MAIPAGVSRRIGRFFPRHGIIEALSGNVRSLWVGATSDTAATVVAKMRAAGCFALDVSTGGNVVTSIEPQSTGANNVVRFAVTGLTPGTAYTYRVRNAAGPASGAFRTHPTAPGVAANFTVAFSGDADTGSDHVVFDAIRASDPLMFLHGGDIAYPDISTNAPHSFQAMYDGVFDSARQLELYSHVATAYVPDDHDYGANNSDGTSASRVACAAAYRNRVPHYPLPDATGMWQTFDIGRVRFILTEQRSSASTNATTDSASKTMLGAAQKTWFKNLLSNSPGKLIVWVCPRHFASGTVANHDSWGGFPTERTEIGTHVAANCPGRVIVLSFDVHVLGIDDGSNRTFGGNAFPTFQAAPLDQTSSFPGDTFSQGGFGGNGQWGKMAIADTGGGTIGVTWTGHDSTGATLVTHSFSVAV